MIDFIGTGRACRRTALILLTAVSSTTAGSYTYTTNHGTATVTGYAGDTARLAIPRALDGLAVTGIGDHAFSYRPDLTQVSIPDSVTHIGAQAFAGCGSLQSIAVDKSNPAYSAAGGVLFDKARTVLIQCPGGKSGGYVIPAGVTNVGIRAFDSCTGLTAITVSRSVTNIGDRAFDSCSGLKTIAVDAANPAYSSANGALLDKAQATLIRCPEGRADTYTVPDTVTNIVDWAFAYCGSLAGVTMGAGVTRIGDHAFYSCSGLTGITLPDGVTGIGDYAFSFCSKLTSLAVPNGVTRIGNHAFEYCTRLAVVAIPGTVTRIGDGAFASCAGLSDISISNGVRQIGTRAFASCTSLLEVVIPASVTEIGEGAFEFCVRLVAIMVDALNPVYNSADGILFRKDQTTLIQCPAGKTGTVEVPAPVAGIANGAFAHCGALTAVYFRASAPALGSNAFAHARSVIYYPEGAEGWSTNFGGRPALPDPRDGSGRPPAP